MYKKTATLPISMPSPLPGGICITRRHYASRVSICQRTGKNPRPKKKKTYHCWARLPRPETAPPSLPNCLPSPDRTFGAGAAGGGSFTGTGGGRAGASLMPLGSNPSPIRKSPIPSVDPSSMSAPSLCRRRARSWTARNFSKSSFHRMMPSSRPFSLLGLSKLEALGVVAFLRYKYEYMAQDDPV